MGCVMRTPVNAAALLATCIVGYGACDRTLAPSTAADVTPVGMVWIPGGDFLMGSEGEDARPDEGPVHRVHVKSFWMDRTEVTNDQFAAFVGATNYVTLAERPVDWEVLKTQVPPGTPKPPADMLQPGSLVFTPPDHAVALNDPSQWWTFVHGANWRHPEGPASSIDGKSNRPVVQVAFEDALAYCAWAHKRLPTEAEWEYAARGGLEGKRYAWGDDALDPTRCNVWQGEFPYHNTMEDGFATSAPVGSYAPNGYGLADMAGNVWEWCADQYDARAYAQHAAAAGADGVTHFPSGPGATRDPRNPLSFDSRVHRGGSFLCNPAYCSSYRPSARMACTSDSSLQHLGFRCVKDDTAGPQ